MSKRAVTLVLPEAQAKSLLAHLQSYISNRGDPDLADITYKLEMAIKWQKRR